MLGLDQRTPPELVQHFPYPVFIVMQKQMSMSMSNTATAEGRGKGRNEGSSTRVPNRLHIVSHGQRCSIEGLLVG